MLSKQASTDFTKRTNELTVVAGYADTLQLSSALQSRRDAIKRAGDNLIALPQYQTWYPAMSKSVEDATAAMMSLEITPADWVTRCQKAADTTAKDTSVHKFHR
jgi:N-acetylglucosamine transport system substrate-binding protein